MGRLQRCLRALRSTVSGHVLPRSGYGGKTTPLASSVTTDSSTPASHPRSDGSERQQQSSSVQKLIPLRRSNASDDVSAPTDAQTQAEICIDSVHIQLDSASFTIFVYDTGQGSSPGDICFAPNESLLNGITPSLAHVAFNTPQVSSQGTFNYDDLLDALDFLTDLESEVWPDTPCDFLTGHPLEEDGLLTQFPNPFGTDIGLDCDTAGGLEEEEHSLEGLIEDMLSDCVQHLPLLAFPLRVPEINGDPAFMASLHLPSIRPLMPRKLVAASRNLGNCSSAVLPINCQLPEEEPPVYTFYPPGFLPTDEAPSRSPNQTSKIVSHLQMAATLLHREVQIASALGILEGRGFMDSHMSSLLCNLGRLVKTWPDNVAEGVEAFRSALSDGILLRTFVTRCLPQNLTVTQSPEAMEDLSQESNFYSFIEVYESIAPPRQEVLRVSSFEDMSIDELGAYSRAIISIHDIVGGFLAPPFQRFDSQPAAISPAHNVTVIPPTVHNTPVLRPLPIPRRTSAELPFYYQSVPTTSVNLPGPLTDTPIGLVKHEIPQLPEEETTLYRQLLATIRDEEGCQLLLQGKSEAQSFLDILNHLLSFPQIIDTARSELLTVLIRLATTTCLYPRSLAHANDPQVDKEPVTSGGYSEILRGNLQEQGVCVKVVRLYRETSKKQKNLKAFMREIALWGQLEHPNILPFYGVYHLDGAEEKICLVSPWMENGTLPEYLKSCPDASKLLLARDVALGLEYLHGKMLVHGDLKGANVLVTLCGRACLADFGLASVSNTETIRFEVLETTGHDHATPRYEAPELLFNDGKIHRTTASDMYAFGCVCYEIFTQRIPFYEVASGYMVVVKLMNGEVPTRPDDQTSPESAKEVTDNIWSFITSFWSVNPLDRPSASECISSYPLLGVHDARPEEQAVWSPSKYRSTLGHDELRGKRITPPMIYSHNVPSETRRAHIGYSSSFTSSFS